MPHSTLNFSLFFKVHCVVKTINMETALESSTETDIHNDSNDLSTKEYEGTVNMQTE